MKAIILLGTLKKEGLSHTEVLCDFLTGFLEARKVSVTKIKLVEKHILAGTYSNMGKADEWPAILKQILEADIVLFATPIWWSNQSSEIQRVIERLDELHDEIMAGKESKLAGKTGGIIITGGSDGAQQIIANVSNFYNAIGLLLPPYATLSVLWEGLKKEADTTREEILKKLEKEYTETAEKMADQLVSYSKNNAAKV